MGNSRMGFNIIFRIIASGIILALLLIALPAILPLAGSDTIYLDPDEGEIGDNVKILGHNFEANYRVYIYFSSRKADVDDGINELVSYEEVSRVFTTADGIFDTDFSIPYELTTGN
jgi:hypothetical protein